MNPTPGVIRFNPSTSDFEGWNGYVWVSLTSKIQTGLVFDGDGNLYPTRVIAGREWMLQNLRTTKYSNQEDIARVDLSTAWPNQTSGAWCWHNTNSANDIPYGKLYNWFTVADPRGVCPMGWKVPSDNEWSDLIDFLGGQLIGGGKLKEVGLSHWSVPNQGATNESGFGGVAAGFRSVNGNYSSPALPGNESFWWSSTQSAGNASSAQSRMISKDNTLIGVFSNDKHFGFSIRCVKAATN